MANKVGAPRQYNAQEMIDDLRAYIDSNDNPIIEEFLLSVPYCKDTLYRFKAESTILSDTIKELHCKQEVRTVHRVENGDMPVAWAIFKMKQPVYGWTDKQTIDATIKNTSVLDKMLEQLE